MIGALRFIGLLTDDTPKLYLAASAQQDNGVDCGAFVVLNALHILRDVNVSVTKVQSYCCLYATFKLPIIIHYCFIQARANKHSTVFLPGNPPIQCYSTTSFPTTNDTSAEHLVGQVRQFLANHIRDSEHL